MPLDVSAKASWVRDGCLVTNLKRKRSEKSWIQYRYVVIFLGSFGLLCTFAMRVNLNVAMVVMVNQSAVEAESPSLSCSAPEKANATSESQDKQDGPFKWDRYTQGLILGAFYYGYIITPIPGGRMAELFGGKWLFGIGALITGFLSLLIPYVAYNLGATCLIALRIVQGLGEGVTYPAMEALMAHWLPVGMRTTGLSLVHAGGSFGVVSGMAISGVLADSQIMGGWPSVFYSFGLLTVVWFVFWVLLVSDQPDDHPWISQEEVDIIENDLGDQKPSHAKSTPWKEILLSPAVMSVAIALFGANWLQYILVTELPTYLGTVLHFNIKDNGVYSSLPYLGATFSGVIAGPCADLLRRRGCMSMTNVRKLFNGLALFLPSLILLIVTSVAGCDGALSLVLFAIAGTLRGVSEASVMSAPVDMAPDYAGTLLGIAVCFGNITGFLVPWVTGLLIRNENSISAWSNGFYLTATIGLLTGLFYQFFSSSELQPWGISSSEEASEDITESRSRGSTPQM